MKPHLPLSLLSALLACTLLGTPAALAVEIPDDYTAEYLCDPSELYDYRTVSTNKAFLLDGSVPFSPSTATWWQSGDLKSNGSILFTIEEDGDPYSLSFKDASYQAFDVTTLRIEDIGKVSFTGINTTTGSSSCGAIEASFISLLRNREVNISNNRQKCSNVDYRPKGGAICTTTSLKINENTKGVTISANSASQKLSSNKSYASSSSAYGGAIYGGISASISLDGNSGGFTISENFAASSSHNENYSSYSYSYGGAIYGGESASISLDGNSGDLTISGNYASASASKNAYSSSYSYSYSYGGAIYGGESANISLDGNLGGVTISGNYATSTSSSSYSYGGAIYGGDSASISLDGNLGGVTITGNYASSYSSYSSSYSYGGAIYGGGSSYISLNNNSGDVTISDNRATSTTSSYSSYGGAIYGGSESTLDIKENEGLVTFARNQTSSTYSYGGAIYLASSSALNISDNQAIVLFTENEAQNGGAIYAESSTVNLSASLSDIVFRANSASYGGAIYSDASQIILTAAKGELLFENNTASSCGGAIYDQNGTIYICNNTGTVKFSGNTAQQGAAIYGDSLVIQNNESVVFEQNLENQSRLRSIYLNSAAADGGQFHLSAAAGKNITFEDSVYVATNTSGQTVDVVFNGSYTDADETSIAQEGDIIFDGGKAASVLQGLKADASDEEILNSQTSYIGGVINLQAGRLVVRNGAHLDGLGLSTKARSGAVLVLQDGHMNHSSGSINLRRGTSLELNGQNSITAEAVSFSSGSTLQFSVGEAQRQDAVLNLDATLEHFSINVAVNGDGMLASGRYKLLELADAAQYDDADGYWNADDISVTATGDAAGLGFNDLVWEDGVLYVVQGKTIWSNSSGNGVWNGESANWLRNGVELTYRDGMDVQFDDTAAGTVQLEGKISPLSVVVDNSTGHDYTFAGSGSLSGETSLEKSGNGVLNLATANEHTGGTYVNEGVLNVQHSRALGAAEAVVVTAAGSQLNIENNATVVLAAAEGNDLAGQVSVAAGASLEVKGTGYQAEATKLAGELIFSGEGVNHTGDGAGSLSGSGILKVQGTGTAVRFSSAADFSGSVALANGAEFAADVLEVQAGASLMALAAGAQVGLDDMLPSGAAQVEMHTTQFVYRGRLNAEMATNTYTAGTTLLEEGLVLQGGASYQAECSSVDLGGCTLAMNAGAENPFITLNLVLDGTYTPGETQIVLFTGVSSFVLNGVEFGGSDTAFVFAASDYLKGDYVVETTALVYDGNVGCVYLTESLPEPTTTTLSLLALAALAARRRRK